MAMRKTSTLSSLFIIAITAGYFFAGCNIVNPTEKIPTYIHVDSFKLKDSPINNITAVWVYYNGAPVGIFDLPATFPVMAEGTGTLQLAPGIASDGQNSQMEPYPFYTFDTMALVAQPGHTINHIPTTTYYSAVKMDTISAFTAGHTNFSKWAGNVAIKAVNADSLVFENGWSGAIFLNAVGDSSVDSSNNTFAIPPGQSAYIEFAYKTSIPFYLGLQAHAGILQTNPRFLVGVKPDNSKWQKFYFKVQPYASEYQATSYTLYIKAVLQPGQTSGRLLLDNIKLVTF
jgi:hypothetical protein